MTSTPQTKDHTSDCTRERAASKKVTGIFGGSFNPIHNGHIALAKELLTCAELDEIWFVVSPQNPLKSRDGLLDDSKRLRMTTEALAEEPRLHVSDYEFLLPRPSFMRNTLAAMSNDHPDREFVLLIGADNWACFDRWFAHKEIIDNYRIVIYPRSGSQIDGEHLPASVSVAATSLFNISSTEIRGLIANGKPFEHLVPPTVAEHIKIEHLYGYGENL